MCLVGGFYFGGSPLLSRVSGSMTDGVRNNRRDLLKGAAATLSLAALARTALPGGVA